MRKLRPPAEIKFLQSAPLPLDAFSRKLPRKKSSASPSPYSKALQQAATDRTIISTEPRALPQIRAQAKKLGYLLHFAMHGDKVLIQIADTEYDAAGKFKKAGAK